MGFYETKAVDPSYKMNFLPLESASPLATLSKDPDAVPSSSFKFLADYLPSIVSIRDWSVGSAEES